MKTSPLIIGAFFSIQSFMQLQELNNWLNNPKREYEQGVALFAEFGESDYLKSLFESYNTGFTKNKLFEELSLISQKLAVKQVVEEMPQPQKEKFQQESIPENDNIERKIQLLKEERSQLFKEVLRFRTEIKSRLNLKTKGRLTVQEVTELMEQKTRAMKPQPFSISYVTWNNREQTGGELISYSKAIKTDMNVSGSRIVETIKPKKTLIKRNPNHWQNSTRNIHPEGTYETRKVNIWLIFEFNGREVVMGDAG